MKMNEYLVLDSATDTLEVVGATATAKAANEKKALKYVIQNCDDSVMHSINPLDHFITILIKLNSSMDSVILIHQ